MLPMPKMPYAEVVKLTKPCKCNVAKVDQAVQVPENGFLDDGQQYVGHDEAGAEIYDVSTRIGRMKLMWPELHKHSGRYCRPRPRPPSLQSCGRTETSTP